VSEEAVDILVDGAVAIGSDSSDISSRLEEAKNLVNSVKDSSVSMAAVEARINSFA
jgi:F-type H+-transporting ATPase subunit epsilon